jgi:hypothetical protein
MADPSFNAAHKAVLDRLLLALPGVTAGKMFGYPAYYIVKKLFACLYGDGVGLKVPAPLAAQLLERQEVVPFQPLGKPRMREWVQINHGDSEDYQKEMDVFRASVAFVRSLSTG